MSDILESATALAEAGVYLARCWGVRPSVGRGLICACNDDGRCRVDMTGAHAVHADPHKTASRDPAVLAGWRRAFGSENLLALCGARSRLAALEFEDAAALQRAQQRHGPLPLTPTSRVPDGTLTALFRWGRPPIVGPDALDGVRLHAEGGRVILPGSVLLDGEVAWAVPPDAARLAGLPLPWRQTVLAASNRRIFRSA